MARRSAPRRDAAQLGFLQEGARILKDRLHAEAAQVIEELIQLAKEMREANARGEQLGLSDDELAFYDALETNDSAVQVLGDETLRAIARELVDTVRNNVTIDWTERPRQASGDGKAHPAQTRLPARQAGEGNRHRS